MATREQASQFATVANASTRNLPRRRRASAEFRVARLLLFDPALLPVVQVCSRSFDYPSDCPCCGAEPDAELAIPLTSSDHMASPDTARRQLFPYCKRCIRHVVSVEHARTISAVILLAGVALASGVGFGEDPMDGVYVLLGTFALVLIAGSSLLTLARRRCSAACASAQRAVTYLGWSGSASGFRFSSAVYTARFAECNTSKLVSVEPGLAKLLEGHTRAREEVPTPAAPVRAVTPHTRAAWSVHFAAQPGSLARRRALSRALGITYEASERAALISMIAHAELDGLIADINGQSLAARRRRARSAIDEVSSDNLLDELREVMLRELRMMALAAR
jgi:hypothetical protein